MRLHGISDPEQSNVLLREGPNIFRWIANDPIGGSSSDRYGDDPWQTPLWVCERALQADGIIEYNQVVGHTQVSVPEVFKTVFGDTILLTCTLDDQEIILESGMDKYYQTSKKR